MDVLVLNCGSSSAKFAVIDAATSKEEVSGIAQRLGSPDATLDWKRNGAKESRPIPGAGHEAALRAVGTLLNELGLTEELVGIGHRVVHGGSKFSGSMAITPEVIAKVEECIPLGPLHNPPNLVGIRIARELFPDLPQVGVFDTASTRRCRRWPTPTRSPTSGSTRTACGATGSTAPATASSRSTP